MTGQNPTTPSTPRRTRARFRLDPVWLVLVALYAGSAVVLKPWSLDFPLNDDWAYTFGVQHWLRDGRLRICDWSALTQVLQIFWGALWVKVLGGGLGTLKMSTVAAAATGAFAFNALLKTVGIPVARRLLAVLLLAANPMYYCLSFSFMTEVPYLCLTLLAFQCYVRAERDTLVAGAIADGKSRVVWILAGSVAAGGAYLVRQTGLLIPIGYCLYLLTHKRLRLNEAIVLWAPPLLAAAGYQSWFHFIHGPTWASVNSLWTIAYLSSPSAIAGIPSRLLASALLLGFWILPLAIGLWVFPRQFGETRYFGKLISAVPFLSLLYFIAVTIYLLSHGWMPHLENTFNRSGLGTMTVGWEAAKAAGFWRWDGFWIAITLGSLLAGWTGLMTGASVWSLADPIEDAALHIVLISCAAQFLVVLARNHFYDRYIIILLPAALLVLTVCSVHWKFSLGAALAAAAALAVVSGAGTQDYLSWNAASWAVARTGVEQGLAPEEIFNGFTWNAYWTYERNMARLKATKPLDQIGEWEWQRLNPYRAFASFDPTDPAYHPIAQSPYKTCLSASTQYVYLVAP